MEDPAELHMSGLGVLLGVSLIRIRVHWGLHWGPQFLETLFRSGIWPGWRGIYVHSVGTMLETVVGFSICPSPMCSEEFRFQISTQ